jgi:hypothetical protein
MDIFPAHEAAVRELQNELIYTHITFLPVNSTLIYRPCNQEIIQNFNAHYRRYWLQFMVSQSLAGKDPSKQINIGR